MRHCEDPREKRTILPQRRKIPLHYVVLYLTWTFSMWDTCLGFHLEHAVSAVARHNKRQVLSSRRLYLSEFETLNLTDTILCFPALGFPPPRRFLEGTTASRKGKADSPPKYNLNLLLIDHYDSFTYNLYDMLAQLCEKPPIILAKDAFTDWSEIETVYGSNTIDGVILSPGPGTPSHREDIGTLSPSVIQKNPKMPILGVCLGHQIMGHVYGAKVDLCGPVHGQVRPIEQHIQNAAAAAADPLWKNIPPRFSVTRYHSLAVSLPQEETTSPLRPTAYSGDHGSGERILMGMTHSDNPHYGVQFHPESVGSEFGRQLLRNFCDICADQQRRNKKPMSISPAVQSTRPHGHDRRKTVEDTISSTSGKKGVDTGAKSAERDENTRPQKSKYRVLVHRVPATDLLPLDVFEEFLAEERYSVWLDTSIGVQSATSDPTIPSYSSILGAGRNTIEYFGKECAKEDQGLFRYDSNTGSILRSPHGDILTFLQEEHAHATDAITMIAFDDDDDAVYTTEMPEDYAALPFDFRGGHVGYLGYEVRHDSERFLQEKELGSQANRRELEESVPSQPRSTPTERTPTAAFLFLDKSWVYDHSAQQWFLISLIEVDETSVQATEDRREAAFDWMRSTAQRMKTLSRKETDVRTNSDHNGNGSTERNGMSATSGVSFVPNRSRVCYNQNFVDCQEQIRLGESYELCLTNQLEAKVTVPAHKSPLDLYKVLRKRNPAPFSAFLNWNSQARLRHGEDQSEVTSPSLALCCSSPERFVSVKRTRQASGGGVNGDGTSKKLLVEAKPIKGTCARVIPQDPAMGLSLAEAKEDQRRATELQESIKNRAENLMIVDLLRNDLSRVCEVGSVHVAKLMDIESYATVHQMVSTIRGTLDGAKANAVDVLKATFPGGSMTGAPKVRTMEILERLEEGASRGLYSGCLGYISMNGSMDMNIVIRSAVLQPMVESSPGSETQDWKVSIGAGGAITALSESADEYDEMILKASAVVRAVEAWAAVTNS